MRLATLAVALVVVLGLAGGFFVTRRLLKRVDAMTATTQRIMAGDLSGRLPLAGTGKVDRRLLIERAEALAGGAPAREKGKSR